MPTRSDSREPGDYGSVSSLVGERVRRNVDAEATIAEISSGADETLASLEFADSCSCFARAKCLS